MFNKVIMLGNLTRNPELKYMPNGKAVCTIGLACNQKFKKQDGSQGEEVCFTDVAFFGKTAEVANQYLKQGSKVLVEGRLKFEQWQDQNGAKKSRHTIQAESLEMLGGNESGATAPKAESKSYSKPQKEAVPDFEVDEDSILF